MARTRGLLAAMTLALVAGCGDDSATDAADGETGDTLAETLDGDAEPEADAAEDADAAPLCGNALITPDEECDDGNGVDGDGCDTDCTFSCHVDDDCADALACTRDRCEAVSGGQACTHAVAAGLCLIAGECFAAGTVDPDNACLVCDPAEASDDWAARPEGTDCGDGVFCNGLDACDGEGTCLTLPACPDEGCLQECDEAAGECVPAAEGKTCRAPAGGCDREEVCDGESLRCPEDRFVAADTLCRAAATVCDADDVCPGDSATCPETYQPEGTSCDDLSSCTMDDACDAAGLCTGTSTRAPGAPTPLLPQNGAYTGSIHTRSTVAGVLRPRFRWVPPAYDGCPNPGYELQVDDSCAAGDFAECGFPSPELDDIGIGSSDWMSAVELPVSLVAPVGTRYYWRVRACRDGLCSDWSVVRYFDAGRAAQDFDGDGYSDLVVGAPGGVAGGAGEGRVHVYYGASAGVPTVPDLTLAPPGSPTGSGFGWRVAWAGDLNADGFADLAVSAPGFEDAAGHGGRVYLYLGGAAGLPASATQALGNPTGQAAAKFGGGVAGAGDLDGDGFGDLVVGAPLQSAPESHEGSAWVFHGTATGVAGVPAASLDNPADDADAEFGGSVASAGDLNGDGYADVVVGAPNQSNGAPGEGNTFVYFGSSLGIPETPSLTLDNPTNQAGGFFGSWVVSAGDINVNGFSELLVGAPGQSSGADGEGNVFVYYGMPGGPSTMPSGTFDNPANQAAGNFGASVAGGQDVNGDLNTDVTVGAPLQDNPEVDEGNAFLFLGCYCGVIHTSPATVTFDNPEDLAGGGYASGALSYAGDLNGDGFGDLVVGAFAHGAGAGRVFVYPGSVSGLPADPTVTLSEPAPFVRGAFGFALE